MITVDTYRIAAVEQLKTYAEIIDLPLAVAKIRARCSQAVEELGAVDMVFIDTAGRSPRDEVKIRELADFWLRHGPTRFIWSSAPGRAERTLRSAARAVRRWSEPTA